MPLKEITKQNLQGIKSDVLTALEDVSKKYGVTFKFQGGRFVQNAATLKFVIFLPNDDSQNLEEATFKSRCTLYGFKPNDLGRQFEFKSQKYTLVGMRQGRSRFKFIGQCGSKRLCFQETSIRFIDAEPTPTATAEQLAHLQVHDPERERQTVAPSDIGSVEKIFGRTPGTIILSKCNIKDAHKQ
jgi:hypothetical protein